VVGYQDPAEPAMVYPFPRKGPEARARAPQGKGGCVMANLRDSDARIDSL